jgi:hypothetical protein
LTPIFGPSFINECLRPQDLGFGRFKIDPEVVRCATLEAEGWKIGHTSRGGSTEEAKRHKDTPRSAPELPAPSKELRPRSDKPAFKLSSPFESDSDASNGHRNNYSYKSAALEPLELSPKSKRADATTSGWTSINSSRYTTPAPLYQTPVRALAKSLLTEPRYSPTVSWRDAEPEKVKPTITGEAPIDRRRSTRSRKPVQTTEPSDTKPCLPACSGSESDDTDISLSLPKKKQKKPASCHIAARTAEASAPPSDHVSPDEKNFSKKYNISDFRAAKWLLDLHARDAQLAKEPNFSTGLKRKGSPA